ncbi:MAG: pyridoxal-phosphate dependent enzyme [Planctomycetota bacterium]
MIPRLYCSGCATTFAPKEPFPFRCPEVGSDDDIDHVVVASEACGADIDASETNPFLRYRQFLYPYQMARAHGLPDEHFVELVTRLDEQIRSLWGHGFAMTPLHHHSGLDGKDAKDRVWVKDETGNVAGSHKARHLMAVLLHLEIVEELGWATEERPLAIASCGNAALAAALLARAANRRLQVFVPVDAEASQVTRMRELGAEIHVSERAAAGEGDPCLRDFRQVVADGAVPFSCQGSENGLVIEGGKTLGLECICQFQEQGITPRRFLIQVGGGALASSVMRAFQDRAFQNHPKMPVPIFDTVQTEGGYPLKVAYAHLRERMRQNDTSGAEELCYAAKHRSEFMRPWPKTPESIARGILDDETYDWRAILAGMILSGGIPIVVDDATLLEAEKLAREETGISVCATGSAGLAGLLELRRSATRAEGEPVCVLFTGREATGLVHRSDSESAPETR